MMTGFKRIIAKSITWAASKLPRGVQRAFVDGLDGYGSYRLLQKLASSHSVSGFVTKGEFGYMQGSATDISVFRTYAKNKTWAHTTTSLIADLLRQGGTYIDIGGNIGLTTIPIAQNRAIKCHVFEPNPENHRHLTANIVANCQDNNVTVHQLALLDREAVLPFEMSPDNSGDGRVRLADELDRMDESTWSTIEVSARPLDTVLSEVDLPLAVKIDTQGAEPFVIEGGRRIIADAQLVAFEYWPYGMKRMGGDHRTIIEFLVDQFDFGQISKGDSGDIAEWLSIDTIADKLNSFARLADDETEYVDVLVIKDPV